MELQEKQAGNGGDSAWAAGASNGSRDGGISSARSFLSDAHRKYGGPGRCYITIRPLQDIL